MSDLLVTLYPWTKSLHVMSVIAWMAGLFYLPRLFVYHVERIPSLDGGADLFETMERRLLRGIMNPAMIASWVFGVALVLTPGIIDWSAFWPWTKAVSVLAMTWFHVWCAKHRKLLMSGPSTVTGRYYRMMNEVPTLLLVVIVVSIIARPF